MFECHHKHATLAPSFGFLDVHFVLIFFDDFRSSMAFLFSCNFFTWTIMKQRQGCISQISPRSGLRLADRYRYVRCLHNLKVKWCSFLFNPLLTCEAFFLLEYSIFSSNLLFFFGITILARFLSSFVIVGFSSCSAFKRRKSLKQHCYNSTSSFCNREIIYGFISGINRLFTSFSTKVPHKPSLSFFVVSSCSISSNMACLSGGI